MPSDKYRLLCNKDALFSNKQRLFVDKRYFSDWKGNENCRDTDEMRHGINIDGILGSADPTKNEVLIFLQYTVNIAELFRRRFNEEKTPGFQFNLRTYTLIF